MRFSNENTVTLLIRWFFNACYMFCHLSLFYFITMRVLSVMHNYNVLYCVILLSHINSSLKYNHSLLHFDLQHFHPVLQGQESMEGSFSSSGSRQFRVINGTLRSLTVFSGVYHWTLSSVWRIQSKVSPHFLNIHLYIILALYARSPTWLVFKTTTLSLSVRQKYM